MGSTVFERQAPAASLVEESLAGSRPSVFWLDDVTRPAHPALTATIDADLAIVGGGYTGLWTAIRAKERNPDARVVLLEAGGIGGAASGRNGGFVEANLTHGESNGERRWPEELAQLDRLGAANLDAIEEAVGRYRIAADFERTGTLSVAVEPHQIPWLEEPDTAADTFPRRGRRARRDRLADLPRRTVGAPVDGARASRQAPSNSRASPRTSAWSCSSTRACAASTAQATPSPSAPTAAPCAPRGSPSPPTSSRRC